MHAGELQGILKYRKHHNPVNIQVFTSSMRLLISTTAWITHCFTLNISVARDVWKLYQHSSVQTTWCWRSGWIMLIVGQITVIISVVDLVVPRSRLLCGKSMLLKVDFSWIIPFLDLIIWVELDSDFDWSSTLTSHSNVVHCLLIYIFMNVRTSKQSTKLNSHLH